ncbi:MAG: hypothetical protein IPP15_12885 [Saprospiraceae bacterium]|uniref:Major facilitator superfamily (MFS) profile domain-containing protein n=1 Tax=Candidatus Opimibacter skivensis TaxID=2982028 RepID=A0A9D7XQQ8_9BACT|nr:hypothetical protein [Candidatus Opimibacter skivensis]
MDFLILVPAASIIESTGGRVGVHWLLFVYFTHTVGELFLSPVGLSAMTKLAPHRIVGQMMGIWFLGAATAISSEDVSEACLNHFHSNQYSWQCSCIVQFQHW